MDTIKVEEFIQGIALPGAAEAMASDGFLMPVSFLLYDDGQFGIAAMEGGFSNDQEKVLYAQTVNELALGPEGLPPCQAVVYMAEGWYSRSLKPEEIAEWRKEYGSPSADPARGEAIFIWYTTVKMGWGMKKVAIIRDDAGQPSLDLTDIDDDATGFMASDEIPNPWGVTGTGQSGRVSA